MQNSPRTGDFISLIINPLEDAPHQRQVKNLVSCTSFLIFIPKNLSREVLPDIETSWICLWIVGCQLQSHTGNC